MLKYVNQQLYKLKKALTLNRNILSYHYFQDNNEDLKIKIYDIVFKVNKSYLDFELLKTQINFEERICNLENKVNELTNDLKLDKYYNSFFNASLGEYKKKCEFCFG